MKNNVKYYEIGGVTFSVETPVPFEEMHPYSLFLTDVAQPKIRYIFDYVDSLPEPVGKKVFENSYFTAYSDGVNVYRYVGFFRDGKALDPEFALATLSGTEPGIVRVSIPRDRDVPMKASLIYRTLCLEQTLAREGGIIFHSAFIEKDGRAILFTAPSGVGKSTQAELWRKHRGARVINGDCSVIRKTKDGVRAYSLPFSGTSGICQKGDFPLCAVVYLGQAPENKVTRLRGIQAFKAFYEGAKLSAWDKTDGTFSADVISTFAAEVPVFRLDCLPDESAVVALEAALEKL